MEKEGNMEDDSGNEDGYQLSKSGSELSKVSLFVPGSTIHSPSISQNSEECGRKSRLDSGYTSLISPGVHINADSEEIVDSPNLSFEQFLGDRDHTLCRSEEKKRSQEDSFSQFELRLFQLYPTNTAEKISKSKPILKRATKRKFSTISKKSRIIDKSSQIFSKKAREDLNPNSLSPTPLKSSLSSLLPLKLYTETLRNPTQDSNCTPSKQFESIWPQKLDSCVTNLFKSHDFPEDNKLNDIIKILSPPRHVFIPQHPSLYTPYTLINSPSCCLINTNNKNHRIDITKSKSTSNITNNKAQSSTISRVDTTNSLSCQSLINNSPDNNIDNSVKDRINSEDMEVECYEEIVPVAKLNLANSEFNFYTSNRPQRTRRALF